MAWTLGWLVALALAAPPGGDPKGSGGEEPPDEEPAGVAADRGLPPAGEDEAADRAAAARVAEQARELARNPPTEARLGVPIYPGSRFDPETSAAMSGSNDGADYFVFLSRDPPAKVAGFYETKTGKKGLGSPGAEGVLVVVRGSAPWADLGVTVQPNGLAQGWRREMASVVTVRKARGR